jgi:hypothetical protein
MASASRARVETVQDRPESWKRSLDHSAMTESRHLFNSLLRIAARPIHHNAAIPIETRSGVRCRGRTDPDVHLADPVSNAAAGISAALRDLVFQYAAEVIRLLVKVSVKLLSGPGGNPFLRL